MLKPLLSISSISPQEFFVTKGLYEPFHFVFDDIGYVVMLFYNNDSIDCYCVGCGKYSIFTHKPNSRLTAGIAGIGGVSNTEMVKWGLTERTTHQKEYVCSRSPDHVLTFNMVLEKGIAIKIGQYPPYADINLQDIEKYKSLLSNDLHIEFKKAIGLFANGIGAGSMVYLRRIIEKFMIEPAH